MLSPNRGLLRSWQQHRDFTYVLVVATFFRLSAAFLIGQGGLIFDGREGHDYDFYQRIGELSLQGYYPSLHYWLEYPPILSWLIVAIYRLSLLLPALQDSIFWFRNFLASFLAVADAANIWLIYAIELRIADRSAALRAATLYALLFWPIFVVLGWLDPLPLTFLLAAVYCLVVDRPVLAGIAVGLGFMAKVIPAVVAPVALKALSRWRGQIMFATFAIVTMAAVAIPFLLLSPRFFLAGFQSTLSRASWETIWALLEGYFGFGSVATLEAHFDPSTANWQSHPSSLPWSLITTALVVTYLLALRLVKERSPRSTVAFSGLAIILLFLFSKGYSPQFIVYLLPFVLLLMPDGRGVVFALLLSAVNTLEFPIWVIVFQDDSWFLAVTVILRTTLWIVLGCVYLSFVVDGAPILLTRLRDRVAVPAAVLTALLILGLGWPLVNTFFQDRGEFYDMQQYLRPLSRAGQGVVLSRRQLVGFSYPFLDGTPIYVLPDGWEQRQDKVKAELNGFAAQHSQVWLLLDYRYGEDARQGFLEQALDTYGAKSTNLWFQTFRLLGYVPASTTNSTAWQQANTVLDGKVQLSGYAIPSAVADGDTFRVILRWHTTAPADADHSVFVHLVSQSGDIAAQRDKVMRKMGTVSRGWQAPADIVDAADLQVPTGTAPGEYTIVVGIYRPDTGARLASDKGGDSISLGHIRVNRAINQHPLRLESTPVDLGRSLRALGSVLESQPKPGEELRLSIYWQALGAITKDYQVSVALVRDGAVVAESKAFPGGDELLPSKWRSGEIVRDQRRLPIREPGRYAVAVKIADPDTPSPQELGGGQALPGGWHVLGKEVTITK